MSKLNNTEINTTKVTDVRNNLRRNHEIDNPCLKVFCDDKMLFVIK